MTLFISGMFFKNSENEDVKQKQRACWGDKEWKDGEQREQCCIM